VFIHLRNKYLRASGQDSFSLFSNRTMLSFWKKHPSYSSVGDGEYDSELKLKSASSESRSNSIVINTDPLSLFLVLILCLFSIIPTWVLLFSFKHYLQQDIGSVASIRPLLSCVQDPTRREWRTLTVPEQHDYIRAVRCLATKPSKLDKAGTLYDDFPWMHKQTSINSTFRFSTLFPRPLTDSDYCSSHVGSLPSLAPLLPPSVRDRFERGMFFPRHPTVRPQYVRILHYHCLTPLSSYWD